MAKKPNPVIEVYKGVNIRAINEVRLSLNPSYFKKIIDEVDKTGLSIHKVIAYSGKPCDRCKNTDVTVYDSDGNPKYVRRGILHIPDSNGVDIITKAKNRCNKQ